MTDNANDLTRVKEAVDRAVRPTLPFLPFLLPVKFSSLKNAPNVIPHRHSPSVRFIELLICSPKS
jgi:hypothetical protein